ncbi:hypothetical protein [Saccharicrinis sp. FJH54]|uniref:hypothetical protein n=1 Tax=Saccharicrinis sp. FJH54 TaxID=3344665 RepID=UPI0035D4A49A
MSWLSKATGIDIDLNPFDGDGLGVSRTSRDSSVSGDRSNNTTRASDTYQTNGTNIYGANATSNSITDYSAKTQNNTGIKKLFPILFLLVVIVVFIKIFVFKK